MASATAAIPRFLLPQTGLIWRRVASPSESASISRRIVVRFASSKPNNPSGARVLAKPERFNPPSHGSRLPKKTPPRHYGGELSTDEVQAQAQREYPGMMAPQGTRAYWLIHSRWIHVVITVGTLSAVAIYTFALSFQRTSPFADLLPPLEDYLRHPLRSVGVLVEVLRLHEAHKTARISEKRKRNVEDVAKRAAYRKAHGLPEEMGLFNQPMARIKTDDEMAAGQNAAAAAAPEAQQRGEQTGPVAEEAGEAHDGHEVRRLTEAERREVVKESRGKWLGIF